MIELISLVILGTMGFSDSARADVDTDLADASRYVEEMKSADVSASLAPDARFYKKNDRWVVAVSHVSHGMVRKTGGSEARADRFLDPRYYEFHVIRVDPVLAKAEIEVTQVGLGGTTMMEARAPRAIITVDRQMKLVSKKYFRRDLGNPIVADFDEHQNFPSGFDSFPLELPDPSRARLIPSGAAMDLSVPPPLEKHKSRWPLDPSKTVRLESHDLFSRPVRVAWQRGDLWPSYVETNSGVSMLIRQEKL